jgi:hypothetical protein
MGHDRLVPQPDMPTLLARVSRSQEKRHRGRFVPILKHRPDTASGPYQTLAFCGEIQIIFL